MGKKSIQPMFKEIKRSRTIIYLLIGYAISVILFATSWMVASSQMSEHIGLMVTSEKVANKMNVIATLIGIARDRTRLSHQMLLSDDVFEKDEIAQSINALAAQFIVKRKELLAHDLTEEENTILQGQLKLYPIVIDNLNIVSELALEETRESDIQARSILNKEIIPTQRLIISGFMRLMQYLEEEVKASSRGMQERHQVHHNTRNIVLIFTFLLSTAVIYLVTRNVLKIESRLYQLSMTDALTGISNRRMFDEKIREEWHRALRTEKPLSLLLIDIDYFKRYNDLYGHQEGDNCLTKISNVLKSVAHRSEDVVARYGGEEFAVILPNVDEAGATIVAERLISDLRAENIVHGESDIEQRVSISIGQTSIVPALDRSLEEFIRAADYALYQSKNAGRNQVTTYTVPDKALKLVAMP